MGPGRPCPGRETAATGRIGPPNGSIPVGCRLQRQMARTRTGTDRGRGGTRKRRSGRPLPIVDDRPGYSDVLQLFFVLQFAEGGPPSGQDAGSAAARHPAGGSTRRRSKVSLSGGPCSCWSYRRPTASPMPLGVGTRSAWTSVHAARATPTPRLRRPAPRPRRARRSAPSASPTGADPMERAGSQISAMRAPPRANPTPMSEVIDIASTKAVCAVASRAAPASPPTVAAIIEAAASDSDGRVRRLGRQPGGRAVHRDPVARREQRCPGPRRRARRRSRGPCR